MCDIPQRGDKILVRNWNGNWTERIFISLNCEGYAVCVDIQNELEFLNGKHYQVYIWEKWKIKPQVYGRPMEPPLNNFKREDKVTDGDKVLIVSKVYSLRGIDYFMGGSFLATLTVEYSKLMHYKSADYVLLSDK